MMKRKSLQTFAMGRGMNGIGRRGQGMRRAVLLAALGLAVVTLAMLGGRPAPAQAQAWTPVVRLFEHLNFGGASIAVAKDDWYGQSVLSRLQFDDKVSSIQVPPGSKVAVFEHPGYLGRCEVFTASDGDLRDNHIGDNTISSVAILGTSVMTSEHCPVVLYEHPNFGGQGLALWEDQTELGRWINDSVTSIQVPAGQVVSVWQYAGFTGRCETFKAGDGDLRDNHIGDNTISSFKVGQVCPVTVFTAGWYGGEVWNAIGDVADARQIAGGRFDNTISSIRVPAGMKIAVYRDINFTGLCETIVGTDGDLSNNRIGNDTISSWRLGQHCQVVVYTAGWFGGQAWEVTGHVPDLRQIAGGIFDNTVSSIQVPPGLVISVYQDTNYTGACELITADDLDLRDNRIGNDTISSFRFGWYC